LLDFYINNLVTGFDSMMNDWLLLHVFLIFISVRSSAFSIIRIFISAPWLIFVIRPHVNSLSSRGFDFRSRKFRYHEQD